MVNMKKCLYNIHKRKWEGNQCVTRYSQLNTKEGNKGRINRKKLKTQKTTE